MKTLGSFKQEIKSNHKIIDCNCRHGMKPDSCDFWNRFWSGNDSDQSFREVLSRARMFSPSSCINNIREFKQNILENKIVESSKVSKGRCKKYQKENRIEDSTVIDPKEFERMLNIHKHLIMKTSKLVDKAKRSQYGGFFSPRRLRNRIKLGNFSQLIWSPEVVKRKALSPWEKVVNLNKLENKYYQNENMINNVFDNSTANNWTSNRRNFRSDSIMNKTINNQRIRRLKTIAEKYQNMERNEVSVIDDDYFKTQQKIKSNFSF